MHLEERIARARVALNSNVPPYFRRDVTEVYQDAKQLAKSAGIKHSIDATTLACISLPIMGVIETQIAHTTDETSLMSRMIGAGLIYAGVGGLFDRLLHLSRRGTERMLNTKFGRVAETAYALSYTGLLVTGTTYAQLTAAHASPEQIQDAVAPCIIASVVLGLTVPPALDAAEELAGYHDPLKEKPRLPESIRAAPRLLRYATLATALTLSAALFVGHYRLTTDTIDMNEFWQPVQDVYSAAEPYLPDMLHATVPPRK